MTPAIHILNGSTLAPEKLAQLAAKVERIFGTTTDVASASVSIDRAFDQSRGQHNSTALLVQLINVVSTQEEKNVLVVDVDLYIPVLTFVFGEAQLNGSAAVVSMHRLQNQFYGLPHDDNLAMQRLEKEIVHELGHTFGLFHCRQFECVMRSSTYVEEIDLKKTDPCEMCSTLLKEATQAHSVCIKQSF